jgi:hypothetical protein
MLMVRQGHGGPSGCRSPTRGPRLRTGGRGFGAQGMVTAEFAVVLPAVILVLGLSLAALGLAMDQVRCVDAARAGARAASRGDSPDAVILVARRGAPSEALVTIVTSGELVRVSVLARPRRAGLILPTWLRASSTATATLERGGAQ